MYRSLSAFSRLLLILALGVTVATAAGLAVAPQLGGLHDVAHGEAGPIELSSLAQRSYVYAADGSLIATFKEEENRAPITLDQVPQHLIDAVLAMEDDGFYDHRGVNARATVRALLSNVESGEVEQGGSTITQQLVKQSLLTPDQDFDRKLKEAFLAVRLEEQMSKDEILERYLNTIYLANHSYGVQAAAETYFGVEAAELDLAQSALLAGLIRNPIAYDPIRFPDVARDRRRLALRRMVDTGAITQAEADAAEDEPLPEVTIEVLPQVDTYFVEEVKRTLLDDPRLGATQSERFDAVFRGGLQIHTTFDPGAQFLAEAARNVVLEPFAIDGNPALFVAGRNRSGQDAIGTVAMASVEPQTGAVRALVGGPGFGDDYEFNLATQGYRQPGSSMKVYVLLSLLEQGYSPNDRVSGIGPCTFRITGQAAPYSVGNFSNSSGFVGSITSMTTASSNCGYLRLGQIAGLDNVVDLATDLGLYTRDANGVITELSDEIFSTPLGTQGVTPLAMAGAYAAIANDGYYHPPYLVEEILDHDGEVVFRHRDEGFRAFSIETAQLAADILRANVRGGTGTRARVNGHDVGGKTGTTNDSSNAWFVGFSRQLATSVWMGAIEGNVGMRRVGGISVTGGSYPARIFGEFMRPYLAEREPVPFADPPRRPSRRGLLEVDKSIDISQPITTTTEVPETPDTTVAPPPTSTTAPPTTSATTEAPAP